MSEDCVREKISSLLKRKKSDINDFSQVSTNDFQSVRCVNRRIRVPDGEATYDYDGLRELYRTGSIYVRLVKSFYKWNVSESII